MKSRIFYLYQITNIANGMIYIGVHATNNINDGYMGSGKRLAIAIKKYGISNFVKIILEYFSSISDMYRRELEIVNAEFVRRPDTYNLRIGGFGGFDHVNQYKLNLRTGMRHTTQTKTKISSSVKQGITDKQREASRQRLLTNPMHLRPNINTKAMGAQKGVPKSLEHREKISKTLKNKILSEAEIERRRQSMKTNRLLKPGSVSEETRAKLSQANYNAWSSGKRRRPAHDWTGIQQDIDSGMKKKNILIKHNITRHVFDYGLKMHYIVKQDAGC